MRPVKLLSAAPAEIARRQRRHMANMLDPQWNNTRRFPCFVPGMTTAQYIAQYKNLNGYDFGHRHTETTAGPLTFTHVERHAALYDPAEPVLVMELVLEDEQ